MTARGSDASPRAEAGPGGGQTIARQLVPIDLDDKIAELRRELRMRHSVYPRAVGRGGFTGQKANRQIAVMQAILDDYLEIEARARAEADARRAAK